MCSEVQKKVLIVEDEVSLLHVLAERLRHEDLIVFEACDGREGLDVAMREKPDLILLDIIMPKMDGLAMLKALRANAWGDGAAVVLLTNVSDGAITHEAAEHHVSDYLVKSDWSIEHIVRKVKAEL